MPKRMVSVPVSDETASEAKVGKEVRIVIVGRVERVEASRVSDFAPEGETPTVWPAEIGVEVDSARVMSASIDMEKLMDDDEE